jgi:hypothetical protein
MADTNTPHDGFFKRLFGDLEVATDFMQCYPTRTSRNQTRVISEKLDDLQIALKPALGAAFSDSSKIFCQEMTRFHDEDTIAGNPGAHRSRHAEDRAGKFH